jgi:hypothetical protein
MLGREFRPVTFDRKLDVKRLQAVLSKTMREAAGDPSPDASLARPERIWIEADRTTVFLSGDAGGVEAVGAALRKTFPEAKLSMASREDAACPPASMPQQRAQTPRSRRPR